MSYHNTWIVSESSIFLSFVVTNFRPYPLILLVWRGSTKTCKYYLHWSHLRHGILWHGLGYHNNFLIKFISETIAMTVLYSLASLLPSGGQTRRPIVGFSTVAKYTFSKQPIMQVYASITSNNEAFQ